MSIPPSESSREGPHPNPDQIRERRSKLRGRGGQRITEGRSRRDQPTAWYPQLRRLIELLRRMNEKQD